MDTNRLNRSSNLLIAASAIVGFICTLVFGAAGELTSWFMQLTATIIAASLAGALALRMYTKQQSEKRAHIHSLLISYCDYLQREVNVQPGFGNVSINYVNSQILQKGIQEEQDSDLISELVKLQGHIETYSMMTTVSLKRLFQQNSDPGTGKGGGIPVAQGAYITNAARVLVGQAALCKRKLLESDGLPIPDVEPIVLPGKHEILKAIGETQAQGQKAGVRRLSQHLASDKTNFSNLDMDAHLLSVASEGLVEQYINTSMEFCYVLSPKGQRSLDELAANDEPDSGGAVYPATANGRRSNVLPRKTSTIMLPRMNVSQRRR